MRNLSLGIRPDELFVELLIAPGYRWVRHTLFAIGVFMLGVTNFYDNFASNEFLWQLFQIALISLPIALNVYLFVPRILFRDRPYRYLMAVAGTVATVLCLNTVIQYFFPYRVSPIYNPDYGNLTRFILLNNLSTAVSFALIITGTTSVILLQRWLRDRKRIAELEAALAMTELGMLKNQINPHFLFNMLNNAIVLTKEDPAQAREVIVRLKEMIGYQLETSRKEYVLLEEEIGFLNDLLLLEKIRRDRFSYSILVDGPAEGVQVPPLLFIPFVENALKHGNDNTRESYIRLGFEVSDGALTFRCSNSVPRSENSGESGGLGLKNITRRLELLYGKEYRLDIVRSAAAYDVDLKIKL